MKEEEETASSNAIEIEIISKTILNNTWRQNKIMIIVRLDLSTMQKN